MKAVKTVIGFIGGAVIGGLAWVVMLWLQGDLGLGLYGLAFEAVLFMGAGGYILARYQWEQSGK